MEITIDYSFLIFRITFMFLLFRGLIEDIPRKWIEQKLWENDTLKHKVKPRIYGIISHCLDMIFFVGMLIVSICLKQPTYSAIFMLVNIGYTLYLVDIYSRHVRFTNRFVYFRKFNKLRVISIKDIAKICWESPTRGIGYLLVIYVTDGTKISLAHEVYIGLRALSKLGRGSTGDGSMC